MLLSHILWNTQNHKQKCFNSIQYEKFKIKLNVYENKPTKLHSRVVNDDYLWSFRTGITGTVFLPDFSTTHHAIDIQGYIEMTYQQFRALKGVWPKPDVATPINRSAIFNQKFKAGNLCWASLVESHQGSKEHSQPRDTSPLWAIPKPMSTTHSAHCYLLRWIFHQQWQDFFPSPSLPNPAFIFALLTTCHCHITATLAVLETWPLQLFAPSGRAVPVSLQPLLTGDMLISTASPGTWDTLGLHR